MSYYGDHPRLRRTSEPIDWAVWHWFICNGPHGEGFEWHRDVDLLRKVIAERQAADPGFVEKARFTALEAITSQDPIICITGLQVLSILGQDEDLEAFKTALEHKSNQVRKHARAALFERGIKVTACADVNSGQDAAPKP